MIPSILGARTPTMLLTAVFLVRSFLTVLSLVLAVMAVSAWNRRRLAPEARVFSLLILSAAIYCFGYAGEVAQTSLPRAMFWLHVEYFGIPWIPALWLLGVRNHNGLRSRYDLLFVVPLLTFAGQMTNSWHGFYDRTVHFVSRSPFWIVAVDRGPIAWLNIAYLNFALLYGAWIYLFRSSSDERNRKQTWVMVGTSLAPLCGYLTYLFGWSPWGLDLAPLTLGVSVVLGYLAVFRYGYIDLVPMAHSLVFNNMRDAVLVSDLQLRLVDFNPAARELLPCLASAKPGDELSHVLRDNPVLAKALLGHATTERLDLEAGGENKHFVVRVFPLYRDKRQSGSAAILADITDQVRMLRELQLKAETDALTGVANRHYFVTAIERECARSVRYGEPFSVAIVDLDYFKNINDQLGHHAGDSVLLAVADLIYRCLRTSDLLSRYGGDEFVVLLPQTVEEGALEVCERIRESVANSSVVVEGQEVRVSVSIGIATHKAGNDTDWQELLKQADTALYDAKKQGRNRVSARGILTPSV